MRIQAAAIQLIRGPLRDQIRAPLEVVEGGSESRGGNGDNYRGRYGDGYGGGDRDGYRDNGYGASGHA